MYISKNTKTRSQLIKAGAKPRKTKRQDKTKTI